MMDLILNCSAATSIVSLRSMGHILNVSLYSTESRTCQYSSEHHMWLGLGIAKSVDPWDTPPYNLREGCPRGRHPW